MVPSLLPYQAHDGGRSFRGLIVTGLVWHAGISTQGRIANGYKRGFRSKRTKPIAQSNLVEHPRLIIERTMRVRRMPEIGASFIKS